MFARIVFFIVFVTCLLLLPVAFKKITCGFRIAKMHLDFPYRSEWETEVVPSLEKILNQRFYFLGKGAQSYVFEDKAGQYVIKLFRYDQPMLEEKIVRLFNACKIAYDELKEETGLIYIHLNQTSLQLPILHFQDAIGRYYKIPLDKYRFAVQKKAKAFRETLQMARGNAPIMQKRIDQFLTLLLARTRKGILNSDPNLSRNFGFLEDRAIEFDFGNYLYDPKLNKEAEMRRFTSRLKIWLQKQAPEWVFYLDEEMKKNVDGLHLDGNQ
jgi:hypothetical protein